MRYFLYLFVMLLVNCGYKSLSSQSNNVDWLIGTWSHGEPEYLIIKKNNSEGLSVETGFGPKSLFFNAKVNCEATKCKIINDKGKKIIEFKRISDQEIEIIWSLRTSFMQNGGYIESGVMPVGIILTKEK